MQPTAQHLMKGLERRAQKGFQGYPLGIIAFYGYNDQAATKAVIGIVRTAGGEPENIKKWEHPNGDLRKDVPAIKELFRYIESHGVVSVALTPGIYYCPHEPGVDFPEGEACSACAFWSAIKKPNLFKTAKAAVGPDRLRLLASILENAVSEKKTLPYGDVMQSVGLRYQDAVHRKLFKEELRTVTRQSKLYAEKLLISAVLVLRIQHLPEDDFFVMAQEMGLFEPGKDSKTVFFKEHLDCIFSQADGV